MKVVILCGGKGTRIKEMTEDMPKSLISIGGYPIVWHIMKIYYSFGFNDFILPIGYRGHQIKEYFFHDKWKNSDCIFDNTGSEFSIKLLREPEKWRITFIDTGEDTMTGSRIKRVQPYIEEEEFMLTYGDGIANVDINALLNYHRSKNKIATMTGVISRSPYGMLQVNDGIAYEFAEKPETGQIQNGGFFVMNKEIFDYINDDGGKCVFEEESLVKLVKDRQLAVYLHKGIWASIDTYKDYVSICQNWKEIRDKLY
ncbi:sugar phosphate nucleotidyltransferase [Lutispora saccharofermentans]|uniref:sugar phosphate nucleotidyltransferase n=1 Tax=Lutispora saccharofermentans TaxID=3024236 RepID=UPI0038CBF7F1